VLVAAAVLSLAAWAVSAGNRPPEASPVAATSPSPTSRPTPPPPSPTPTPAPVVRCPLSGLPVDDPAVIARTPLLVQIENNPDARPPANLGAADMVIEAPVEGDVTRYSAVFQCQPTVGWTGPIRSARYNNIDFWQDVHVLTVGFGASPGALDRYAAAGMPYVNGIYGQWPWFARGDGFAPHNLYGDLESLRASFGENPDLDALAAQAGTLRPPFAFDPNAFVPAHEPVSSITIQTNYYWAYGWLWSPSLAAWQRIDGGEPLTDRVTGAPITAHAVIVQRVHQEIVYGDPDPGGNPRRDQFLVGSGDATLFLRGRAAALTWSRPSADEGTTFTVVETGAPLVLRPGVVWWEIVPEEAIVVTQ
jgi:hypothetical protein